MRLPRIKPQMLEKYQARHVWHGAKRYYLTPTGENYPGVTTILSNTKTEKTRLALEAWRVRVGEIEAAAISKAAAARGTAMHAAIEASLLGEPVMIEDIAAPYFESMQAILPRVSDVHLVEGMVWHQNGFAGSVDCVARYQGELSLIDWKTSDKPKRANWIDDYFLQCSAYCAAINRMYDLRIGRIVIAIAVPGQAAQVFTASGPILLNYWELFNDRLAQYKSLFSDESERAYVYSV